MYQYYDYSSYALVELFSMVLLTVIGAAGGWFLFSKKRRRGSIGAVVGGIVGFLSVALSLGGIVSTAIALAVLWFALPAGTAASSQAPISLPAQHTTSDAHIPKTASRSRNNSIFISYRRSDSAEVTGRIYDRLVGHFGKAAVFKDVDSIPFGADFRDYLVNVIGGCGAVIAVIGPEWLGFKNEAGLIRLEDPADFVRIELETALMRNVPIIPLLVRGAVLPKEQELVSTLKPLAYRNAGVARNDPDFHNDMDRLIKSLQESLQ